MSSRHRVLETLNLRVPDRVPVDIWFSDETWNEYTTRLNQADLNEYFGTDVRRVYFDQPSTAGVEYHYPFPDQEFAACSVKDLADKVHRIQERGYAVVGHVGSLCSEIATSVVGGMENYLVALADRDSSLDRLLEEILATKIRAIETYARAGADVVQVGDDFGSQHGLILSPSMWREWFKPRIARAVEAGRQIKPDVSVLFHSDGNIEEIIPDLIETGITAINPVQPECMRIADLSRHVGQVAFWGGIGTQSTLPFAGPQQVKQEVIRLIETLGSRGGLVVCSSHMVQAGTPLENVAAFFEAARLFCP
jgi:uroporphyrinogen decarboxylase